MSMETFSKAWQVRGLMPAERLVFLWVAESTSECAPPHRPDLERIGEWAGLSVGVVEGVLSGLVKRGLLVYVDDVNGYSGYSVVVS